MFRHFIFLLILKEYYSVRLQPLYNGLVYLKLLLLFFFSEIKFATRQSIVFYTRNYNFVLLPLLTYRMSRFILA